VITIIAVIAIVGPAAVVVAIFVSLAAVVLHGFADEIAATGADGRTDQRLVAPSMERAANGRTRCRAKQRTFAGSIATGESEGGEQGYGEERDELFHERVGLINRIGRNARPGCSM